MPTTQLRSCVKVEEAILGSRPYQSLWSLWTCLQRSIKDGHCQARAAWSLSGQSCSSLTQRGCWVHCVEARMQTNPIPHPLLSLLVQSSAQHSKESALKRLWYMGPLAHIQIILMMSFNIQTHRGLGHCFRFFPSGQLALVNKLETHYFSLYNIYILYVASQSTRRVTHFGWHVSTLVEKKFRTF